MAAALVPYPSSSPIGSSMTGTDTARSSDVSYVSGQTSTDTDRGDYIKSLEARVRNFLERIPVQTTSELTELVSVFEKLEFLDSSCSESDGVQENLRPLVNYYAALPVEVRSICENDTDTSELLSKVHQVFKDVIGQFCRDMKFASRVEKAAYVNKSLRTALKMDPPTTSPSLRNVAKIVQDNVRLQNLLNPTKYPALATAHDPDSEDEAFNLPAPDIPTSTESTDTSPNAETSENKSVFEEMSDSMKLQCSAELEALRITPQEFERCCQIHNAPDVFLTLRALVTLLDSKVITWERMKMLSRFKIRRLFRHPFEVVALVRQGVNLEDVLKLKTTDDGFSVSQLIIANGFNVVTLLNAGITFEQIIDLAQNKVSRTFLCNTEDMSSLIKAESFVSSQFLGLDPALRLPEILFGFRALFKSKIITCEGLLKLTASQIKLFLQNPLEIIALVENGVNLEEILKHVESSSFSDGYSVSEFIILYGFKVVILLRSGLTIEQVIDLAQSNNHRLLVTNAHAVSALLAEGITLAELKALDSTRVFSIYPFTEAAKAMHEAVVSEQSSILSMYEAAIILLRKGTSFAEIKAKHTTILKAVFKEMYPPPRPKQSIIYDEDFWTGSRM